MKLDKQVTRELLESGKLKELFNEMGWNNPPSEDPVVLDHEFSLLPIAEKHGVMIFRCDSMPKGIVRKQIERQIAKRAIEHLIIFVAPDGSRQVWQWVARRKGEADKVREHVWRTEQSPELLIQKLDHITFTLDDEEGLTLFCTIQVLQDAFDREKITKKFYEAFKTQHNKLLGFIEGLDSRSDQELYASLMLNRLMFVYFIQKKGFLDKGDLHYLRNRFDHITSTRGPDKFHSFYRAFLLKLFHNGLAIPPGLRHEETIQLIGDIPFLNGGLFERHALEREDSRIHVPDEAFVSIFDFFDQYEWTLDTRPIKRKDGREINPDVLGHIFEKYINQKEMGAYYTKEDITGYITENTVIPWLFRHAESVDAKSFSADGLVGRLLHEETDRYIYEEVSYGTGLDLPEAIAAGINDVSKRGDWNKVASSKFGLETETWRETIARRQRWADIREKLKSGRIMKIEDFITYNLNLRQLAQDVIQYAESPELVLAFWDGITSIKVLDPACGSGAFLFAALNVLHDLYEACLERMKQLVDFAEESNDNHALQYCSRFEEVLNQVDAHPNPSYYINKHIILSNLYGVDIMDEAIEICKLRLFLKLAAQLENVKEIEPLPDIDFNIRAGNSLIGYTSIIDVESAIREKAPKLDFEDRVGTIKSTLKDLSNAFISFRENQMRPNDVVDSENKAELRSRLKKINDDLNLLLAKDYEVKEDAVQDWCKQVEPFHWLAEFYENIMERENGGGFDVIIGNPPYLEASEVKYSPRGIRAKGTIQGYFVEQSSKLLSQDGGMSMVLPLSLVSSKRMEAVQNIIESGANVWYSNYSIRPAKLFEGADIRITIFISAPSEKRRAFTTGYKRWLTKSRNTLMPTLSYVTTFKPDRAYWIPKFQHPLEIKIFHKIMNQKISIKEVWGNGPGAVYYRNTGGAYWWEFTNFPPKYFTNGKAGSPTTQVKKFIKQRYDPVIVVALLSSTTFWWYWTLGSDCWHLPQSYIETFKTNPDIFDDNDLLILGKEYIDSLLKNSYTLIREQGQTGTIQRQSFRIQKSKPIIDRIEAALSRHYNFTVQELDFIQNYEIKFRIGDSDGEA